MPSSVATSRNSHSPSPSARHRLSQTPFRTRPHPFLPPQRQLSPILRPLAELTGTADAETIRDIEYGRDVKLSHLKAVADALGLELKLVEQTV